MKILTISDLHAPFSHGHALDFLRDLKREIKPDVVVSLGDEVDFHNFARWPRDWEACGKREELQQARDYLKQLARLFPVLTIVESNHTWRPWKQAALAGLVPEMMRARQQVLDTPDDWIWVQAARYDDVTFIHGEGFSGPRAAIDAAVTHRCNMVIGHIHAHAGVAYSRGARDQIFAMNVGCLVDATLPAFSYGKHARYKPVIGTGAVLDGVPFFFPLEK